MHDIYILGSGAMGSLWESYFDSSNHLHFIQRQVKHPAIYEFNVEPYNRQVKGDCLSPEEIQTSIQCLIIATKAYDALTALNGIQDRLAPDAMVILLQNGLGSQQAISKAFPTLRLFACSSTEGAYKKNAQTLVHAGKGINCIGALNPIATQASLKQWLPSEHFQWHNEIDSVLWRKFMINCAINPLTVLYNCQNGELIKQQQYLTHMQQLCDEIDVVTHAQHYQIENAFDLAKRVCELTANNFSSMLQDKRKGNPTELSFMTGYLLQQAKTLGIDCPHNQAVYQKLSHP